MNWAMTSLPVPLSPLMNTDASVGPTCRASSTALRKSGEIPSRACVSESECCRITWLRRSAASRPLRIACEARPISTWRGVALNGLGGEAPGRNRTAPLTALEDRMRGPPDQHLEVGRTERLGEVVPGTHPDRLDTRWHARIAGHHDHQAVAIHLQGGVEDIHPRHLGHEEVDQHQVELPPPDQVHRLLTASCQHYAVPLGPQHRGATLPQRALVIHDQDANRRLDVRRKGEDVAVGARIRGTGAGDPVTAVMSKLLAARAWDQL